MGNRHGACSQLVICRLTVERYVISFAPPSAVAPAWVPTYTIQLSQQAQQDVIHTLNHFMATFAQGALTSLREPLLAFGQRLAQCFLPEPICHALRQLAPGSPLLLATNASEFPWELLCPGDEVLALERPLGRQLLDAAPWSLGGYERWRANLSSAAPGAPELLLIANPTADLPASDQEAERILEVIDTLPHYLRCTAFFRQQATRPNLLNALQSGAYTLIHYSGHAEGQQANSEPGLRLADGLLNPQSLANALPKAPLIFLNACRSAQTATGATLASALLQAGARACVGASWPVSDAAAADFSATFYQRLLRGELVGEALWQARLALVAQHPNDPTWAAYTLYGDPTWQPVPPPAEAGYFAVVLVVRLLAAELAATTDAQEASTHRQIDLLRHLARVIMENGGALHRLGIDSMVATFGIPQAQDDQCQRAVQTAVAAQAAANQLGLTVSSAVTSGAVMLHQARLGLETPPNLGQVDRVLVGPSVELAFALSQQTHPQTILADQTTYQATRHLFEWLRQPDGSYQLVRVRPLADTLHQLPLVGRVDELATLMRYWQRCCQQRQRQVVGLVGEAGIGKSRLLAAFRQAIYQQDGSDDAAAASPRWVGVTASAQRSTTPFALLRSLLAQGLGLADQAEWAAWQEALHNLLGESAAERGAIDLHLFGRTLGLLGADGDGRDVAESIRRAQLSAVAKSVLASVAQQGPVILAIDDLYQSDQASLDLLNHLLDTMDDFPLLWLVLYRREWAPPWISKRRCHTLDLDELDHTERATLVERLLPAPVSPTIHQAIVARGGGNPFYLEQLAHSISEGEDVTGAATLPATLRLVVLARWARLPMTAQLVARLSAVAGSPFDPVILQRVLIQSGEVDNLLPALERLVACEFLRHTGRQYAFYHPLLEEILYAELPTVERQSLHRRLADVLATLPGSAPTLIAWHHLRSVTRPQPGQAWIISLPPFGDHYPAQVLASLQAAAEVAWHSYANREAVRWWQAGLDLIQAWGRMVEAELESRFQAGMGKALARLGEFAQATHHLQLAFAGAAASPMRISPLIAADLARQIGRLLMRQGRYNESLSWMARASALAGETTGGAATAIQAHIEVHTGSVYHWQGNLDQAAHHYQAGIALAEKIEAPISAALAEGCNGLGVILRERGQVTEAIAYFERALAIWRRLDDLYEATRVQENLGNAYFSRNDWQLAHTHYQQSLVFWERIEDRNHTAFSLLNLGGVHLCWGAWADAESCYRRALGLWESAGDVRMPALAHINLGRLALARGELGEARLQLEQGMYILDEQGVDSFRPEAYLSLAQLELQEKAPAATLIWAERALVLAQQLVLEQEMALAHRLLGQAQQQFGEWTLARQHLSESLTRLQTTANRHELGRTWLALAAWEVANGQPAQARQLLEQASALFGELGARPDQIQAEEMLSALEGKYADKQQ
jgi:tetratricopeptide (TPR) repeat protein